MDNIDDIDTYYTGITSKIKDTNIYDPQLCAV